MDVVRETDRAYAPGTPVRVRVVEREGRYRIDDLGGALDRTGRPAGWRETAERTVRELGWNVSRQGVVFVRAVAGRDIEARVGGTADASLAVFDAVAELDG